MKWTATISMPHIDDLGEVSKRTRVIFVSAPDLPGAQVAVDRRIRQIRAAIELASACALAGEQPAPEEHEASTPYEVYRARAAKLRKIVRTRQEAENPVTVRELAMTLQVSMKEILEMIEDEGLSYNVAILTGAGVGDLPMGDYTVEDLNV